MGGCCSRIHDSLPRRVTSINRKHITLLAVGLDGGGKTTVIRRLCKEPLDTVVPTVGFSTATLHHKGCLVTFYDVGGGPQIRDIWHRYYADVHGIIFVVDAKDMSRLDECKKVLEDVLRHEAISGKPVLLLANKQDMDGALDEIDVVEKLNIEPLVNEQRCPTLVELCSARHFSKKMDIGIDNGFKWLLRSIIKDYPALNNRVLLDITKQAEESRREVAEREERLQRLRDERQQASPIPVEKPYQNGISKHLETMEKFQQAMASIPGAVEDDGETSTSSGRAKSTGRTSELSRVLKTSESNVDLLQSVGEQTKNFLVRPKSSGANLFPSKSESRQNKKRKRLKKSNKTGPNPFSDITNVDERPLPKVFDPTYYTDISVISSSVEMAPLELPLEPVQTEDNLDMFLATSSTQCFHRVEDKERRSSFPGRSEHRLDVFTANSCKSMPNSRKNSASRDNVGGIKLPPLQLNGKIPPPPVLLDVTMLGTF